MIFTQLYYSFRNYSNKTNIVPLGRWKKINQDITLYLASIDNCYYSNNIKFDLNKYIRLKKK